MFSDIHTVNIVGANARLAKDTAVKISPIEPESEYFLLVGSRFYSAAFYLNTHPWPERTSQPPLHPKNQFYNPLVRSRLVRGHYDSGSSILTIQTVFSVSQWLDYWVGVNTDPKKSLLLSLGLPVSFLNRVRESRQHFYGEFETCPCRHSDCQSGYVLILNAPEGLALPFIIDHSMHNSVMYTRFEDYRIYDREDRLLPLTDEHSYKGRFF